MNRAEAHTTPCGGAHRKDSKPRWRELDADLRRFITKCWERRKPVPQRSGMMTWLAVMPNRHYQVGDGRDGGSVL